VFQDKQLQDLIHTALQQNYDVRIVATRILEAQAQLGITRADQLPTINAGVQTSDQRSARAKLFPEFETSAHEVNLSLAWDLDFWGKYRRATESARANLLATEWSREAVITTLVSDVAAAYFQLRELDLELEIARRTLASRQDSLRITQMLANGGASPCSTSGRPSSWCSPRRRLFLTWSGALRSKKTSSVPFSEIIPVPSHVE
jgi:multidrug efflux system outer membrane protein